MNDIAGLVGEDSRAPIQRLRRFQLWKIAEEHGIKYPNGATKEIMVKLFEAHNIDVTQSSAVNWRITNGVDADGRPHQELYPVIPPGASHRNGVNAYAALQEKISVKEEEEKKFRDAQIDALRRENAELKQKNEQLAEIMESRLAALEGKKNETKKDDSYWDVYRKARDMGIKDLRGKKLHEIEAMIAKANG